MQALDTSQHPVAFLNEGGRSGIFVFREGNHVDRLAEDGEQGLFVEAGDTDPSDGAWNRWVEGGLNVEWFGAVPGAESTTAIQAAIDLAEFRGGGVVYVPNGYIANGLTITGVDIHLVGDSAGKSHIQSIDNTGIILKASGSRHAVEDLLVFRNVFSSTTASQAVNFEDAVQCSMDRCRVQGGFFNLVINGNACADNTFTRNTFTFATGAAMVKIGRGSGAGVNGAQHFYRCTFNQEYPLGVPVAANYRGARGNGTTYVVGDIAIVGSYYLKCRVGGVSGGSAPVLDKFYGEDITDGAVQWRLMAHASYRGAWIDTGTSYIRLTECDLTGPFANAIEVSNAASGEVPFDITVTNCTAHGPVFNGFYNGAGREIHLTGFNALNATGPGTTYGVVLTGAGEVQIVGSQAYGFTNGIYVGEKNVTILANHPVGNTVGVNVGPAGVKAVVVGNQLKSSAVRGSNTTTHVIDAAANPTLTIASNSVS